MEHSRRRCLPRLPAAHHARLLLIAAAARENERLGEVVIAAVLPDRGKECSCWVCASARRRCLPTLQPPSCHSQQPALRVQVQLLSLILTGACSWIELSGLDTACSPACRQVEFLLCCGLVESSACCRRPALPPPAAEPASPASFCASDGAAPQTGVHSRVCAAQCATWHSRLQARGGRQGERAHGEFSRHTYQNGPDNCSHAGASQALKCCCRQVPAHPPAVLRSHAAPAAPQANSPLAAAGASGGVLNLTAIAPCRLLLRIGCGSLRCNARPQRLAGTSARRWPAAAADTAGHAPR